MTAPCSMDASHGNVGVCKAPLVLPMRVPATGQAQGIDREGASGLLFDMKALNSISVTAIETGLWRTPAAYELYVAKEPGTYNSGPPFGWQDLLASDSWELLAAGSYGGPQRQPFRIEFQRPVSISAGTVKAFYLYGCVNGDHRVVAGTMGRIVADENLEVYPGDCARPTRWKRFRVANYEFAGSVEYKLMNK